MTSEDVYSITKYEFFRTEIKELKQMKTDLQRMNDVLTNLQTEYRERVDAYETKLEQLHLQANTIQQEHEEKETNLLNATKEWLDIKTKLESSVMSLEQRVKLNVGGEYFETTIGTLTKSNRGSISYFKAFFSRQWQLEKNLNDESIFIDRDGYLFGCILQYLRTGRLNINHKNPTLRQNLIIEAEFYNIGSLVRLLNMYNTVLQQPKFERRNLYSDTKILSENDQEHLNKLFGNDNQQWQLIYRASRDGHTAESFHKFCDGRGPSITIIRSKNGYVFGGFTTVTWSSTKQDTADILAFLFTMKNPHGIKPTKYSISEQAVRSAVSHRSTNGPTFGSINNGGSDIHLQCSFNTNGGRIFFPNTYTDTTGRGRVTFTGSSKFSCDDIEIFIPI